MSWIRLCGCAGAGGAYSGRGLGEGECEAADVFFGADGVGRRRVAGGKGRGDHADRRGLVELGQRHILRCPGEPSPADSRMSLVSGALDQCLWAIIPSLPSSSMVLCSVRLYAALLKNYISGSLKDAAVLGPRVAHIGVLPGCTGVQDRDYWQALG